jgi:hypothetical protein
MKLLINKGLSRRILLLTVNFCVLISLKSTSYGQELAKVAAEQPPTSKEVSVSDRVRLLEDELERQNSKLDELKKTIADQQLAIRALIERLSPREPAKIETAANAIPATSSADAINATDQPQPQAPTVEQRLAKVEGQAIHIGPLRLSGDFRLRFDGTFRSASDPDDPPLQHLQNARARYRLRLNFDTDLYPTLSFHGQLATGPLNNPQTLDQDFTGVTARHPMAISEAWIDYHPTRAVQLQAGRVQAIFADNSRFLFDDDIRFNGFNERYVLSLKKNSAYLSNIDFRAGQYILTNPNVAIIAPNSPLARAGQLVGSTGRSSNLFHQGVLVNQAFNERWSDQIGVDVQLYRNPNQIQLASTADGVALLVQPGLGLALSGPLTGIGTATTTNGGAIYTAPGFQIARLAYRLNYAGFKHSDHNFPVTLNLQFARNMGTGLNERDAMLASLQVGRITKKGDTALLYIFAIKGANALISQVTDDDLGTGSGVNIRTSHFRFEYGIARKVTLQSLFFFQQSLRSSGQYPNFFVPLGAFAPTTYRLQQQIVFSF